MWFVFTALAAPLDDEGPFEHVITLHPTTMAAVGPFQKRRTRALLVGADDEVVLAGQQDMLGLDSGGAFDWDAPLDTADTFLPRGVVWTDADGAFTYCDKDRGPVTYAKGSAESFGTYRTDGPCRIASDGAGGWHVIEANLWTGKRLGPDRKPVSSIDFSPMEGALKPVICGLGRDGRMMVTSSDNQATYFAIAQPNPEFTEIHTRFFLDWRKDRRAEDNGIRTAGLYNTGSCDVVGDTAAIADSRSVLLFEGTTLIHAIRNGSPVGTVETTGSVRRGKGPWAHDGLSYVRLMDEGRRLVTIEGASSKIRLYVREPGAPRVEEGRKAASTGDHLLAEYHLGRALEASPEDDALRRDRLENMLAAGWWLNLIINARESDHPMDREYAMRARGQAFLRWDKRRTMTVIEQTALRDRPIEMIAKEWLPRFEEWTSKYPDVHEIFQAQALLAERAGDETLAMKARQRLAELSPGTDLESSRSLAWARGDLEALRESFDDATPNYWRAQALRLDGDFEAAAQVLEGATTVRSRQLAGTIQLERGEVGDAVRLLNRLAATEGKSSGPVHRALGRAYLARGLTELAVESLLEADRLAPGNPTTASLLVSAYASLDRDKDAMTAVFRALSDHPDDPVLQFQERRLSEKPAAGDTDGAVAILPLTTRGGRASRPGLGELVSSMLTTAAIDHTTVVERTHLESIMDEQSLRQSAWIAPSDAMSIGSLAGARQVLVGNVAEWDSSVSLDLRLVDVKSGKAVRAWSGRAPLTLDGIRTAVEEAAVNVWGRARP